MTISQFFFPDLIQMGIYNTINAAMNITVNVSLGTTTGLYPGYMSRIAVARLYENNQWLLLNDKLFSNNTFTSSVKKIQGESLSST